MARVKHLQTNGKIEKWFDTYRRFRQNFDFLTELLNSTTIGLMVA
jgi:hypothetical protein